MLNISVIIPVYNAEVFLQKAVDSALQFNEVKEIILVEDKSTDNSLELCRKLVAENPKINLFQHFDEENHGAGASRNLGLEKASQEFIAFLDADDYYLPNRFDAEKEVLKDKETDGVFGALGTEFLTENGKVEFEKKFKNVFLTTVNYAAEGKTIFLGLLGLNPETFGTFFHLNTLTVRNATIKKIDLKFNENLRVHQDSDFITKLAWLCNLKTGIIDKAVAVRGVHDDNRITKIIAYSAVYKNRQLMLWESLDKWTKQVDIPKKAQEKIHLTCKSFHLSQKMGIKLFLNIVLESVKNPRILKTRYRFNFLGK